MIFNKKCIWFYFKKINSHVLMCIVCYNSTPCASFKSMTEVHSFYSIFLSLLYGKSLKVTLFIPFILQTMSISKSSVKALYKFLFFGVMYGVFHWSATVYLHVRSNSIEMPLYNVYIKPNRINRLANFRFK